jgi:hypothetical protein
MLLGNNIVFDSFASLLNASTYCSATFNETASEPPVLRIEFATISIPFAVASATHIIASASPLARFT